MRNRAEFDAARAVETYLRVTLVSDQDVSKAQAVEGSGVYTGVLNLKYRNFEPGS